MNNFHRAEDTATWEDTGPDLAVTAAGRTDRGRVRSKNEDQFLVAELAKLMRVEQSSIPEPDERTAQPHGHLFLVADGMGGHAGGEVASRIAARTVEECLLNSLKWFLRPRGEEGQQVVEHLQGAVHEADARVFGEVKHRPELAGMGCTLTLALAVGRTLFVAHVGDSRAYLFRGGTLYRLTHDHTLFNELVARGALLPGQEQSVRLRHVITNAVGGGDPGVKVEVTRAQLEPGDRLLLCTDGLTDLLDDDRIAATLKTSPDPQEACDRLVADANDRGGHDNITAVIAVFA
ncbi:MAG TPA: protein phosphatase 2C domain-containing protein [Gemmataceae bacterium]|jgi:protein phosphatase